MENKVFEADEIIQSKIKTKFKGKVFIGTYVEKRLCDALMQYRDVVVVDKAENKDGQLDLDSFLTEIRTMSSAGCQVLLFISGDGNFDIWTELDDDAAFGKYWFQVNIYVHSNQNRQIVYITNFLSQIKTIKFRFNEIQIKLKRLRSIDEDNSKKSFTHMLRLATGCSSTANELNAVSEWRTLYEFWKQELAAAVTWMLSIVVNLHTITETLRFVMLLIVSLFAGSTQIIKYLGFFAINLIERTTWLVYVLTPLALGKLN